MRLTADVLLHAENYLNAYRDREVSLRGLKIPAIENLSVLQDQYDVIDLSDNDIKKVDNLPTMNRLDSLLLNNNSITRISPTLGDYLPRLQVLILNNNKIQAMYEIDHMATLKQLEVLSLLENPIKLQQHYRAYIIHKIPQLKTLDFVKISRTEREEAKTLFSSSAGKLFLSNIQQEKAMYINSLEQKKQQANNGGNAPAQPGAKAVAMSLTEDQRRQVKEAIEAANTKEDIDLIEYQLKTGTFEFKAAPKEVTSSSATSNGDNNNSSPTSDRTSNKRPHHEVSYNDIDVID